MKNIDHIIKEALSPKYEPGERLNQDVLFYAKSIKAQESEGTMKGRWNKRISVAAVAAAVIIATGSLSAYAAWKHMKPQEVAEEMEDHRLAKAFIQGDGAVEVSEVQEYGDYRVTLLGLVSGENLTDHPMMSDGEVEADRSYAVLALEKKDGSAMPEYVDREEEFITSPFVEGVRQANIYTMNGGKTAFLQDGVEYQIVDCDNLEIFADRTVYLALTDGSVLDDSAYVYDEKTGKVSRNEEYQGVNALFELPLDRTKADPQKAKELIKEWTGGTEEKDSDRDGGQAAGDVERKETSLVVEEGTKPDGTEKGNGVRYGGQAAKAARSREALLTEAKRVQKEGKLIYGPEKMEVDSEGLLFSSWEYKGIKREGSVNPDTIFKKGQYGLSDLIQSVDDNEGGRFVELYTRDKDGTYFISVYHMKKTK